MPHVHILVPSLPNAAIYSLYTVRMGFVDTESQVNRRILFVLRVLAMRLGVYSTPFTGVYHRALDELDGLHLLHEFLF